MVSSFDPKYLWLLLHEEEYDHNHEDISSNKMERARHIPLVNL